MSVLGVRFGVCDGEVGASKLARRRFRLTVCRSDSGCVVVLVDESAASGVSSDWSAGPVRDDFTTVGSVLTEAAVGPVGVVSARRSRGAIVRVGGGSRRGCGREVRGVRCRPSVPHRDGRQYIASLPFLWLAVDDAPSTASERGVIEAGSIGLLSNFEVPAIDAPSPAWLGRHTDREAIRRSGLWNVNHVRSGWRQMPDQLDGRHVDGRAVHLAVDDPAGSRWR